MKLATYLRTHHRSSPPGESSGQSIVELALMLPVLVIVLAGILDLGRIYFAYITVVNAAREGARYAAAHPPTYCDSGHTADIVTRTQNEATASGINPDQLTVDVACSGGPGFEHAINVTVSYGFRPILTRMLLFGGPIQLRSDATMQIFAQ